jgi:hypothetical protein
MRFHTPRFPAASFNPNIDATGAPRRMEIKSDGSRFNPFPGPMGSNISTLYAGTTEHSAALESVFHDVSHVPDPEFPTSKLQDYVLSYISLQRPLLVMELINSELRQVAVPRRPKLSLQESELIHSAPEQYPITRQWALHFFNSLPTLQGLAWRPRLGGKGIAYVFFGERLSEPTDLVPDAAPTPIHTGPGRVLIGRIAADAHINLVNTKP